MTQNELPKWATRILPKRAAKHVEFASKDPDGYWIYFDCFITTRYGAGTAHGTTLQDLKADLEGMQYAD